MDNQSITFFVDLEVENTQWKIGLNIFDLAIVCRENPEFRFESNKQINISEKRLLTFEEYAPTMIKQLSDYCNSVPHEKIYFLSHNGFDQDYIIIFDNLERSGHLKQFSEAFSDALFLDSLAFFRSYKKIHKGQFIGNGQQVPLKLPNLCEHFINYKYYANLALPDAESLIKLMDFKPQGSDLSFLLLNEHKDYASACKTFSEVFDLFEKKKKIEKIRHAPDYGAQFKLLEAELSHESVLADCIYSLLDAGINWFFLVELGKSCTRKEINQKLKGVIVRAPQRKKIVNWCLKLKKKTGENGDCKIEEEEEENDDDCETEEEEDDDNACKIENQMERERQKTEKIIRIEKQKAIKQEEKEIKKEEMLNEKERKRTEKFIENEKKIEENLKEKERIKAEKQEMKEKQKEEKLKEKERIKAEKQEMKERKKEENQKERERIKAERQKERQEMKEKQREEKQKEKERKREAKQEEIKQQKEENQTEKEIEENQKEKEK